MESHATQLKPVVFSCHESLKLPPEEIAGRILDLERWPEFQGYGFIPAIKGAEFEVRTPEVIGTRIQVTNKDGTSHVELIAEWEPGTRVCLHMQEFSPPLSRLAERFEELWEFKQNDRITEVTRSFRMLAKSRSARLALWAISFFLKRAIAQHLRQMRHEAAK